MATASRSKAIARAFPTGVSIERAIDPNKPNKTFNFFQRGGEDFKSAQARNSSFFGVDNARVARSFNEADRVEFGRQEGIRTSNRAIATENQRLERVAGNTQEQIAARKVANTTRLRNAVSRSSLVLSVGGDTSGRASARKSLLGQ